VPVWEADGVWTGSNYVAAGTYIQAGRRFHDDELVRMGLEMGTAVATQNWEVDTNGFQFASPGWWSPVETTNAHFIWVRLPWRDGHAGHGILLSA